MAFTPLQSTVSATPAIGYAGQLESIEEAKLSAMKNAEASASIPFGSAVAFKPSGATSDQDATLPANSTDKIAGIVAWMPDYARAWTTSGGTTFGDIDSTGLRVGVFMSVLRAGKILGIAEDSASPGARLFVRYAGGTKGALRSTDAGGSTCIDCTNQAQWTTTATAGNLAWLDCDFRNK